MGILGQTMLRDMKIRNFSPKPQRAYIDAVAGLVRYYSKSPETINNDEIQSYVLYLMEDRKLAWSSCNVVIAVLRFFYTNTLNHHPLSFALPPRKKETHLPEILSVAEVKRLFESTRNMKHRTMLMTAYAAGLRLSELVNLQVRDIDSTRMMIMVRNGKGKKDRYTILSQRLLDELRTYWKQYRPASILFPGKEPHRPMAKASVQKMYYKAKQNAKIRKKGGIHMLRHCFGTHLYEGGEDIRTIQALLGHSCIKSTMIYTKVSQKKLRSVKSPFDLLSFPPRIPQ